VGQNGVDYTDRPEFIELDRSGNLYLPTAPVGDIEQIIRYVPATGTFTNMFIPESDGANYTFSGNIRDVEIVGNRLFVADKDNDRILEFALDVAQFVTVFDDTDIPIPSALEYDPIADRLYVSCNLDNPGAGSNQSDDLVAYDGIAGRDGQPPVLKTVVVQTDGPATDRNIHGILLVDGEVFVTNQNPQTVRGISRVEDDGTFTIVAGDEFNATTVINRVSVTTGGRYDLDLDNDVDGADWQQLLQLVYGPGVPNPGGLVETLFKKCDADGDGDVDFTDVGLFLESLGS
jgi:DNA-binding beta-propeller fold protein YncE